MHWLVAVLFGFELLLTIATCKLAPAHVGCLEKCLLRIVDKVRTYWLLRPAHGALNLCAWVM